MRQRKNNRTAGFSLLEVVVGIAVLGLVTVPVCASLLLSVRLNAHSQSLMNAQLQAAGVVETLLAEGIVIDDDNKLNGISLKEGETDVWRPEGSNVDIRLTADEGIYYDVSVTATVGTEPNEERVTINTSIRKGGG